MKTSLRTILKFKDVEVSKVDYAFLLALDGFLRSGGRQESTINKIHRHLHKILEIAVAEGVVQVNPYSRFKLSKVQSSRKFLNEKDIDLICSVKCLFSDLFRFQVSTGFHVGDLLVFGREKVEEITIDGKTYKLIRGFRKKTGERYTIPLLPVAEEIAERYNYKFDFIPSEYNAWLKATAKEKGVQIKVTSSVGRHSYATISITKGVPIETVSETLGHTSIKTTQIYAKVMGEKVIRDIHKFYGL